jgi:hypothetical protein
MMALFWSLIGVVLAACVLWFLALYEDTRARPSSLQGRTRKQNQERRDQRANRREDGADLSRWADDGGRSGEPETSPT